MAKKGIDRKNKVVQSRQSKIATPKSSITISPDGNTISIGGTVHTASDSGIRGLKKVVVTEGGKKVEEYLLQVHTGKKVSMERGGRLFVLDDSPFKPPSASTVSKSTTPPASSSQKTTTYGRSSRGVQTFVTKNAKGEVVDRGFLATAGEKTKTFSDRKDALTWVEGIKQEIQENIRSDTRAIENLYNEVKRREHKAAAKTQKKIDAENRQKQMADKGKTLYRKTKVKYEKGMKLKRYQYVGQKGFIERADIKTATYRRKRWAKDPNWVQTDLDNLRKARETREKNKSKIKDAADKKKIKDRTKELNNKIKTQKKNRDKRRKKAIKNRIKAQKIRNVAAKRQRRAFRRDTIRKVRADLRATPSLAREYLRTSGLNAARQGQVWKELSRAEKYPAMRHASRAPFHRDMPKDTGGRGGRMALTPQKIPFGSGHNIPTGAMGTMYGTPNAFITDKFPEGGTGIVLHIDATQMLDNLTRNFPNAVNNAIAMAKPRIGKMLLDIVEPYVPKDTGFMYSTAEDFTGSPLDLDSSVGGGSSIYGVSIAYRAPYAEMVYYDESKLHGAAYNAHYGTSEKGELETARWIEVAFQNEASALEGVFEEYGKVIRDTLRKVGFKAFWAEGGTVAKGFQSPSRATMSGSIPYFPPN